MSRSYHVTEKMARDAYNLGDTEPAWQASEKSWVKRQQRKARRQKVLVTNRAIVSVEAARTKLVKQRSGRQSGSRESALVSGLNRSGGFPSPLS